MTFDTVVFSAVFVEMSNSLITVNSSLLNVGDIELVVFPPVFRFCGFGSPVKYRFTKVIKALELHLAANALTNVLAHSNHLLS